MGAVSLETPCSGGMKALMATLCGLGPVAKAMRVFSMPPAASPSFRLVLGSGGFCLKTSLKPVSKKEQTCGAKPRCQIW